MESVIEPIALYGSEVWGPLAKQDFPVNNACRAELGQYPLILKSQKRAIKFCKHLKYSDPISYHCNAKS